MSAREPSGAPYGWRARIGFINPSRSNENIPYEFYLVAPPGVTICTTTLNNAAPTQEGYDAALGRLESAIEELVLRNVDAMIQSGQPPIVPHGWGYQNDVMARIARVTSIPAALDIMCCVDAMQTLQMQRVVLVTPFGDEMHDHLTRFVRSAGIEVVAARSIGIQGRYDASWAPLALVYRTAKVVYQSVSGADGVWITGALMPSVGIIEPLERDLDIPVVSSMQAGIWTGLRLAGVRTQILGYGRLFGAT